MLSEQLVTRSKIFAKNAVPIINAGQVPTRTEINQSGRRVQDKERIEKTYRMAMDNRAKSRRQDVTMATILEEAKDVTPCNNLILHVEDSTKTLRGKVKQMAVVKFWENMKSSREYKEMFYIACLSFKHLTHFSLTTELQKRNGKERK